MARARYDETRFTFEVREDGRRVAYRPGEILVRHNSDPEILATAFTAVGREDSFRRPIVDQQEQWLVPDRVVTDDWGVIKLPIGTDPREALESLRGARVGGRPITVQLNNIYFAGTLEDSHSPGGNRAAPNYAVPNYAVPNYAVPNYAVPNYAVPNYAVPNYAVPNYAVPNYAVPNYAVPNYAVPNYAVGHNDGCCGEKCPAPEEIPPRVPNITARGARVPHMELSPRYSGDLQIHVLDVRPQTPSTSGSETAAAFVDAAAASPTTARDVLIGKEGALLPEALHLDQEIQNPTEAAGEEDNYKKLQAEYVVEPFSDGLGANVNKDGYVDPTTNHGEFIKGIIDRIVRPPQADGEEGADSFVTLHSVMGTLGEVSDAELVRALRHIDEQDADGVLNDDSIRIINLSLAGYPEIPEGGADCLADTIAELIDRGWIVVASAGNDGSCQPTRPASLPGVLSVAAYGCAGPAWFSNHGPWVDACAPGVDVVSDFPNIMATNLDVDHGVSSAKEFTTGYASWSGTSFAAPFAAAMIARWLLSHGTTNFDAAKAALIDHPDALQFPNYGTIVSFASTRSRVQQTTEWI